MSDIRKDVTEILFSERESEVKHPGYEKEMAFYTRITEGRLEEVEKSWEQAPKSNAAERGVLSDNPLRNAMYHMVSMTAVICRLCIRKGLPQDLSYTISDAYIKRADKASSVEEIRDIQWEMVKDYTNAMNSNIVHSGMSKQIQESVNYIRANIHDNITVSELAEVVGLNETYLSKLFKKEMKCTVSEYIRDEKIAEACYLLNFTDKTSIEIANDLSFSSHSYFISVFKKVKGITPKEYRNNSPNFNF